MFGIAPIENALEATSLYTKTAQSVKGFIPVNNLKSTQPTTNEIANAQNVPNKNFKNLFIIIPMYLIVA